MGQRKFKPGDKVKRRKDGEKGEVWNYDRNGEYVVKWDYDYYPHLVHWMDMDLIPEGE